MLTLFYIFAAISIICAFGVLFMRNPIHCALMLVGTFFCLGGIYVMLNAEFVAVIQVLVYAGAIMVLFLFVLMLLSTNEPSQVAVKWDAAASHFTATWDGSLVERSINTKRKSTMIAPA